MNQQPNDDARTLEPRSLPHETLGGLRPPKKGFPYFAHADLFPLDSNQREFSPVSAWWLSDACFLVYGNCEFIEEAFASSPLPDLAWKLDWLGSRDENRGIVLSNDETLVVVFRGTRVEVHSPLDATEIVLINQDDLWIDSQFLPAVCATGGRVHAGFMRAFAEVSQSLDNFVQTRRPTQEVLLTGHSLGGALATLAAAHIGPAKIRGLYTFGCPRVGDAKFAETLSDVPDFRVVHNDDWVSKIPPTLLGYVHTGQLHHLARDRESNVWSEFADATNDLFDAIKRMAKDLRVDTGQLPMTIKGIADHAPIYYSTLLWNSLIASGQQE